MATTDQNTATAVEHSSDGNDDEVAAAAAAAASDVAAAAIDEAADFQPVSSSTPNKSDNKKRKRARTDDSAASAIEGQQQEEEAETGQYDSAAFFSANAKLGSLAKAFCEQGNLVAMQVSLVDSMFEEAEKNLKKKLDTKRRIFDAQLAKERESLKQQWDALRAEKEKILRANGSNPKESDIVNINVGGRKFSTRRGTLCQVPGSLLEAMFSGRQRMNLDSDGCVFLDRSPAVFAQILEYLRDPTDERRRNLPFESKVFAHEIDYFGLSSVLYPDKPQQHIYVVGGIDQSGYHVLKDLERLTVSERSWTTLAPMSVGRWGARCVTVNKKLYLIGGKNTDDRALAVVERYDPVLNEWVRLASEMAQRRVIFGCSVINGKVYVAGGEDDENDAINSVECFDPDTNTWTSKAPMLSSRTNFECATLGDIMYAVGGCWNRDGQVLGTVETYDSKTDTWGACPDLLTPRHGHTVAVMDGMLYVMGGRNQKSQVLNDVERYNSTTKEWTKIAPMSQARVGFGCAVVDDYIFAVGGLDERDDAVSTVEKYDVRTDTWTQEPGMCVERYDVAVACITGTSRH